MVDSAKTNKRIGLTGGIASGKSTVSAHLRDEGVPVIDYDELARLVVEPGSAGLAQIVKKFGESILHKDGSLKRRKLAKKVFNNDAALAALNSITHPLIRQAALKQEQCLIEHGSDLVVHDIPLLVENFDLSFFDQILVTQAPDRLRIQRIIARGLPRRQADAVMARQLTDEQRREKLGDKAHYFDGSGSPKQLRVQVDEWLALNAVKTLQPLAMV